MNIVEFNNGIWIEYPDDFDGPVLVFDNSRYISVEQYCSSFGIRVDSVRVQDGNLLITSARPIPFNTIGELLNWDKITIVPGYNSFVISINIKDDETDNSDTNLDTEYVVD